MRVFRDQGDIKRKKRMATLLAMTGVALLGFAFWLSVTAGPHNTQGVLLAYIPLLGGTVLFHMGMQQVAQWNRSPRNDEALDQLLKGLPEKYALLHYVQLDKQVIPHVLVHPGGLLALTVRELSGTIRYRDGKWSRDRSRDGLSRFFGFGGPQLGNPSEDAAKDVAGLETVIARGDAKIDADAAIVFINRTVDLEIEEPDYPVMNGEGLAQFVRSLPVDPAFKAPDRDAITAVLAMHGEEVVESDRPATRRPVKRRAA